MPPAADPVLVLDDGEVTVPVSGEFEMTTTFTVEPRLERAIEPPACAG